MIVSGKWDAKSKRNITALSRLKGKMASAASKSVGDAADLYKHEVTHMIMYQTGGFAPLSPVWAKKKQHFQLDPRVLIATGKYVQSFQVEKAPMRGSVMCLYVLGRWIEYGTDGIPNYRAPVQRGPGRMPPRPHLIPALDRTKMYLRNNVKETVSRAFANR